jgi:hypothetical protein
MEAYSSTSASRTPSSPVAVLARAIRPNRTWIARTRYSTVPILRFRSRPVVRYRCQWRPQGSRTSARASRLPPSRPGRRHPLRCLTPCLPRRRHRLALCRPLPLCRLNRCRRRGPPPVRFRPGRRVRQVFRRAQWRRRQCLPVRFRRGRRVRGSCRRVRWRPGQCLVVRYLREQRSGGQCPEAPCRRKPCLRALRPWVRCRRPVRPPSPTCRVRPQICLCRRPGRPSVRCRRLSARYRPSVRCRRLGARYRLSARRRPSGRVVRLRRCLRSPQRGKPTFRSSRFGRFLPPAAVLLVGLAFTRPLAVSP